MALDGRGRSSTTLIVENAIEEREGRSECNSGVRMPQPPQQQKHSDHGDRDDRRPERAPEHRGKPCDGDGRSAVIRAHHVIPGAVDAEGQAASDARDQEAAEQDRGDACRAEGDPSPPPTTQPSGSSARPDVRGAASTRCRTDLTVAITRMTASKCMLVTVVPRSNPGGPPRHEGEQQRLSRLGDSVRVAAGPSRILRAIGGIAPGISVSMAAVPGRGDRGVADGCHRLGGPGRGHPACRDLGCRRR